MPCALQGVKETDDDDDDVDDEPGRQKILPAINFFLQFFFRGAATQRGSWPPHS